MRRTKTTFTFMPQGGRFPQEVGVSVSQALSAMGGPVTLTLAEGKGPRSNKQNRYYFGVVVPSVQRMFREAGTLIDVEQTHEYLKENIGGLKQLVIDPAGVRKTVSGSTRHLTTEEFENYMTAIRAWAAEFGMIIPLPNEWEYYE